MQEEKLQQYKTWGQINHTERKIKEDFLIIMPKLTVLYKHKK